MNDRNIPPRLTPREQAQLDDFVRNDLGKPEANTPQATAAGNSNPAKQPVDASGVVNQTGELAQTIKEQQRSYAQKVTPLSPSVEDPDSSAVINVQADHDATELDVAAYARGNMNRVVSEMRNQQAEQVVRSKAKKAKLPFVRLIGYPISPEVLTIVPEDLAQKHGVIAYLRAGHKVRLGVTDPGTKDTEQTIATLQQNTPYEFLVSVIGDDSYRYALQLYQEIPKAARDTEQVAVDKKSQASFEADIKNLVQLKERIKGVPTTKLVDVLLSGAVKIGASDVHIEPTADGVRVRYRLDGVLQTVADLPGTISNALLSRLKFLAKLKLDINRMPQDGRFTIQDAASGSEHDIDIRVATIPVQFGEAVTMRLLDRDKLKLTIDSLGLTGLSRQLVLDAIARPQGMILECGPTGSGKTTTLYSLLALMNDPGKKVITLEDPIEYRLPGIMQSQVEPEHGYDFSEGFRAVLRLDPDIVMVGEIRDQETAEMATQAALTGHVVLSTLHTNDAPTAIPRLIDLGVQPFLLSHAISVIVAQRLVRQVCPHCAREVKPDTELVRELKNQFAKVPMSRRDEVPAEADWLFMEGQGCDACNNSGFSGRIGIFEVLQPDEQMERLAIKQAPVDELKQAAVERGMMTMEQDGLIKAVTGVTTVAEVWRVARNL